MNGLRNDSLRCCRYEVAKTAFVVSTTCGFTRFPCHIVSFRIGIACYGWQVVARMPECDQLDVNVWVCGKRYRQEMLEHDKNRQTE